MKSTISLIIVLLILLNFQSALFDSQKEPPLYNQIGAFRLVNYDNTQINSQDLRGKILIAHFFFTSCPSVCPLIMRAASNLAEDFANEDRIALVSISVDSANDTPAVLKEYAARNGYQQSNWIFLTGPSSDVRNLSLTEFKLGLGEDFSLHSTKMVLIDEQGRLRGYYDSTDPEQMKRLKGDANYLRGKL